MINSNANQLIIKYSAERYKDTCQLNKTKSDHGVWWWTASALLRIKVHCTTGWMHCKLIRHTEHKRHTQFRMFFLHTQWMSDIIFGVGQLITILGNRIPLDSFYVLCRFRHFCFVHFLMHKYIFIWFTLIGSSYNCFASKKQQQQQLLNFSFHKSHIFVIGQHN